MEECVHTAKMSPWKFKSLAHPRGLLARAHNNEVTQNKAEINTIDILSNYISKIGKYCVLYIRNLDDYMRFYKK